MSRSTSRNQGSSNEQIQIEKHSVVTTKDRGGRVIRDGCKSRVMESPVVAAVGQFWTAPRLAAREKQLVKGERHWPAPRLAARGKLLVKGERHWRAVKRKRYHHAVKGVWFSRAVRENGRTIFKREKNFGNFWSLYILRRDKLSVGN